MVAAGSRAVSCPPGLTSREAKQELVKRMRFMIHQPFFIPSLIIALLATSLVFRWIPQNRIYGIRTRRTLADKGAWYAINRIGGALFIVSSATYIIYAWQLPLAGRHDTRFGLWLSHVLFFALPIALSIIWLNGYSKRYDEKKK